MNLFLKWDRRRFFPHEAREKKEQESFVERMFRHSRTYIQLGLAFAMCCACFMAIYLPTQTHETANSQNEIPTPKQQIIDKKVKISSNVGAIINKITKPTNRIEKIKAPVYGSGTNVKLFKTTHIGREKFLDTFPKAFAPTWWDVA